MNLPELIVHKPQTIEDVQDLVRSVDRLYTMSNNPSPGFQSRLIADEAFDLEFQKRNVGQKHFRPRDLEEARSALMEWQDQRPIHSLDKTSNRVPIANPEDMTIQADALSSVANFIVKLHHAGTWHPNIYFGEKSLESLKVVRGDLLQSIDSYRLPYLEIASPTDSLHQVISTNLPTPYDHLFGDWRNHILGMTVVLADGTIAKVGSNAVKNVAGYDAQKLFIGSLGAYGIIVDITLRMYTKPKSPLQMEIHQGEESNDSTTLLHRVLPSDFQSAKVAYGRHLHFSDPNNFTIYGHWPDEEDPPRFPNDQLWRLGRPPEVTETQKRFMLRAKEIFDPTHKLNPGIWGFM